METPSRFRDFFLFLFLKGVTRFLKHTLEKSLFQTQVKQKGFTTTESLGLHCPPVATVVWSPRPTPHPRRLDHRQDGHFHTVCLRRTQVEACGEAQAPAAQSSFLQIAELTVFATRAENVL